MKTCIEIKQGILIPLLDVEKDMASVQKLHTIYHANNESICPIQAESHSYVGVGGVTFYKNDSTWMNILYDQIRNIRFSHAQHHNTTEMMNHNKS